MCYADVGPQIPAGMSLIARRVPHDFDIAPHGEGGEEEEIMHNLEGISRGVLDYVRIDDVPRVYQRHTIGCQIKFTAC